MQTPRNRFIHGVLSDRTVWQIKHDLLRFWTRSKMRSTRLIPVHRKLHFGCGGRRVAGWVNVDLTKSDVNVDLACGRLPWKDGAFDVAIGQHVIEHLELRQELIPCLREVRRILRAAGELWVSCPDIEKICRSFIEHRMRDLIAERESRLGATGRKWTLDMESGFVGTPPSQMINSLFYQDGDHKNLFDFELLKWVLETAGFVNVRRVEEADLLRRYPEFPPREDDSQTVYACGYAQ